MAYTELWLTNTNEEEVVIDDPEDVPRSVVKYVTCIDGTLLAVRYASQSVRFVDEYTESLQADDPSRAHELMRMLLLYLVLQGRLDADKNMPTMEEWKSLPLIGVPTYEELEYEILCLNTNTDELWEWDWRNPSGH